MVEGGNVILLLNNDFSIEKLLAQAKQASVRWNRCILCTARVAISVSKKISSVLGSACISNVADVSLVTISFFFLPSFLSLTPVNTPWSSFFFSTLDLLVLIDDIIILMTTTTTTPTTITIKLIVIIIVVIGVVIMVVTMLLLLLLHIIIIIIIVVI